MTVPFYVAPEQLMNDKADFARKGIARGRALAASAYDGGILLVTENPSTTLHKIAEIYDRIAFGGVGLYPEFETLRVAGVRHADVKGYQYSREDVDARSLASLYGQHLNQVFTHELKPWEVEVLVAEVGATREEDQLFHVAFNGNLSDKENLAVLGGEAETITERLQTSYREGWSLAEALRAATDALTGPDRTVVAAELEAAVVERPAVRRAVRRVEDPEVEELLRPSG